MVQDLDETGPIDFCVIEFPNRRMTGEGLPLLVELVDRGIIRILDMALVEKDPDGTLVTLSVDDLDRAGSVDPAALQGASAGFLNENDINLALSMIEPGSSGGILVYENLWAAPATAALRRGAPDSSPAAAGSESRQCAPRWTSLNPVAERQSSNTDVLKLPETDRQPDSITKSRSNASGWARATLVPAPRRWAGSGCMWPRRVTGACEDQQPSFPTPPSEIGKAQRASVGARARGSNAAAPSPMMATTASAMVASP